MMAACSLLRRAKRIRSARLARAPPLRCRPPPRPPPRASMMRPVRPPSFKPPLRNKPRALARRPPVWLPRNTQRTRAPGPAVLARARRPRLHQARPVGLIRLRIGLDIIFYPFEPHIIPTPPLCPGEPRSCFRDYIRLAITWPPFLTRFTHVRLLIIPLLFILENPGFFVFCICICLCRWYCLLLSSNCRMYHVFNVLNFFLYTVCVCTSNCCSFFFFSTKKKPHKKDCLSFPFFDQVI